MITMQREQTSRGRLARGWIFFTVAFLVVVIDQVSKFLIRANMALGESLPSDGVVRLTYVTNTGASFGILPGQTLPLLITAIIGVVALLLFYFYMPLPSLLLKAALGLQLGGAIGNVIDRILFGKVTDFIDFRVWPIFNLADSSIVVGVGLLVLFLLLSARKGKVESADT